MCDCCACVIIPDRFDNRSHESGHKTKNQGNGDSGHTPLAWSRSLQWRHNERDGASNHQPHDSLLNPLFRHRWKETSKLGVTGHCEEIQGWHVNSPHKGSVTPKCFQLMTSSCKNERKFGKTHLWKRCYIEIMCTHNGTFPKWKAFNLHNQCCCRCYQGSDSI